VYVYSTVSGVSLIMALSVPSLAVQTEATEIRRSASSGYRVLVHIRETRRGSSAREVKGSVAAGQD